MILVQCKFVVIRQFSGVIDKIATIELITDPLEGEVPRCVGML